MANGTSDPPCENDESRRRVWVNVPDGSELHLKVEGDARSATRVSIDGEDQGIVPHGEVSPGPWVLPLSSPHRYVCLVTLSFPDAGTATVKAWVRRPGGDTHPTPYCHDETGEAGQTAPTIEITALTRA